MVIATPMYGGKADNEHMLSCMRLQESLLRAGMDFEWLTVQNESLIARARNVIARNFLVQPHLSGFDALLFIDADIEFTPQDVSALWNLDKPVAGGCYSRKRPGEVPKVWYGGREEPLSAFTSPFKADRLETGFLMIRRAVFQQMIGDGRVRDYDESGQCWELFNTPVVNYPGMNYGDYRDRYMVSEDYYFTDLWKACGGELWVDPGIHLRHWGRMAF